MLDSTDREIYAQRWALAELKMQAPEEKPHQHQPTINFGHIFTYKVFFSRLWSARDFSRVVSKDDFAFLHNASLIRDKINWAVNWSRYSAQLHNLIWIHRSLTETKEKYAPGLFSESTIQRNFKSNKRIELATQSKVDWSRGHTIQSSRSLLAMLIEATYQRERSEWNLV